MRARHVGPSAVVGNVCTFLLAQCGQPRNGPIHNDFWQIEGPIYVTFIFIRTIITSIYGSVNHAQIGKERSTRRKNEGPIQAFHTIRQWPLTVARLRTHAGPAYWAMVGTVCTFLLAKCG